MDRDLSNFLALMVVSITLIISYGSLNTSIQDAYTADPTNAMLEVMSTTFPMLMIILILFSMMAMLYIVMSRLNG